ncbi:TPA: DNA-binding transcriptional regulator DsdC [Pseudomonas putida]|nr:DNA-binding transcriptional regulator DsdC [Pseudomonas putida]
MNYLIRKDTGLPRVQGAHLANLHTFLIAARHLSFSKAADELFLTASAVSHRIARLEEGLKLKLFHRLPRQVSLTADGERFYQIMQNTMDALDQAMQSRADEQVRGQLSLYVRPSIVQYWLIPRLAGFVEQYPDVQLDIRVGNERVDYRTRSVDLVLCYSDGDYPGLVSSRIMAERIAPVCSPEYARRHGLDGRMDELQRCTLIHDCAAWHNSSFDAEWQLWLKAVDSEAPLSSRFLTFDRSDLCMLAAINHAGVAIGREQLVKAALSRGELIAPWGCFQSANDYAYYLVHPPLDPLPRRMEVLVDWLKQHAFA